MHELQNIRDFLLDMDGTIYLGSRLFEGTIPFLNRIRERGCRAVFLTNNSSASPLAYAEKLNGMGIDAGIGDIFTSGDAAAITLTKQFGHPPAVYLLGTPALADHLAGYGIRAVNGTDTPPDCVLLGFDKTLTYERLETACRLISAGFPYYATHPDLVCPVEGGFIPDAGAMMALIRAATGRSPVVFGKPERTMADAASERYGLSPETTAMVGDRLSTDIRFANQAGVTAILVLSGETTHSDYLAQHEVHADWIFPSIRELCDAL